MKAFIIAAALGAITVTTTVPALADAPRPGGRVCISTLDIYNSEPNRQGTAIDFFMRNGRVYHNDLKGRCPNLIYNGFTWQLHGNQGLVCDNEQAVRVLRTGEECLIGKFTEVVPAKHHRG